MSNKTYFFCVHNDPEGLWGEFPDFECAMTDGENLADLLKDIPGDVQPDKQVARRALDEAEKLLYRLRFQVDEKLAIRSFAVNTACGG